MKPLTYRPAVGIVLANDQDQVLLGRRNDMLNQWQFPQGGIDPLELPQTAVFRELQEETGIVANSVEVVRNTHGYLKYDYPSSVIQELNVNKTWRYAGQKVQFFLLRYHGADKDIDVKRVPKPEFDAWKWVDYWKPLELIVEFKRDMYRRALLELAPGLQEEARE